MKQNNLHIILMQVAILVIMLFAAIREIQYRRMLHQIQSSIKLPTPKQWIDNSDRTHQAVPAVKMQPDIFSSMYKKEIDSLTKVLRIKQRQIQELTIIPQQRRDTVFIPFQKDICADSSVPFIYKDAYTTISGIATRRSLSIDYSSVDTTRVVKYTKGKLWWKKSYVDIYNSNPKNKVQPISQVEVYTHKRKRWFSVGPSINYGFDGMQMRTTLGVSLQLSILKF